MLNSSLPGDAPSPQNRRRSRRAKPVGNDVVTMYTADERWVGIIVDQSDGGFGLAAPGAVSVGIGDRVRVTAKGRLIKAKVVSREECPGGVRLGLKEEK